MEAPPARLTHSQLDLAIGAQRQLMEPSDVKSFAVIIERLFSFARTFGLANPDTRAATGFYREALKDVPTDLVDRAVSAVCRDWRWGNKLPLPADLRNQVSEEMTSRRVMLARMEMAAKRLPPPAPPMSEDEKAEMKRKVSGLLAPLRIKVADAERPHASGGAR